MGLAQIASIIGLKISVSRCEAKSKMSQNRPAQDRDNVRRNLEADRPGLADAMARIMPDEDRQ
ncbi:hypothetical protein N9X12_02065 [Alphaproteobacteria bacterium]|nr:hypothetical protein [Alphaproteobacteria bacterium]